MSFTDALRYLDRHINLEARAGYFEDLSLNSMERLMDLSGDPHKAFRSIHVTGTNGKGSTATMIARLMQAQGLRVGRYSSPHLTSITERIEIDGEPVDRDLFAEEVLALAAVAELSEHPPSYFELLTATAYRLFAAEAVEVAVVEVGVLGRFDATNVIEADVAVLTNIGTDHTTKEGDWRRDIAREKAGIAKESSTFVVGETAPDLLDIFEGAGASSLLVADRDFELLSDQPAVGGRLVDIRTVRGLYEDVFVSVHGSHQAVNAAVALAAAEEFFESALPDDVVAEGFGELRLPGRVEVVGKEPLVILDGAHNPEAAQALDITLATAFGGASPRVFVLATLEPRDPAEFIAEVGIGAGDYVVATPVRSPRAISAERIAEAASAAGATAEAASDVDDAIERAKILAGIEGIVIVTGSLYAVGEARDEIM
ncbi:MAG: Mur ligase family protein [Acidimicrobiia bacterium]|nr:Mur ligase family protein [Acidimicrobiia bacterium]